MGLILSSETWLELGTRQKDFLCVLISKKNKKIRSSLLRKGAAWALLLADNPPTPQKTTTTPNSNKGCFSVTDKQAKKSIVPLWGPKRDIALLLIVELKIGGGIKNGGGGSSVSALNLPLYCAVFLPLK